jgi:hypothetical protein
MLQLEIMLARKMSVIRLLDMMLASLPDMKNDVSSSHNSFSIGEAG